MAKTSTQKKALKPSGIYFSSDETETLLSTLKFAYRIIEDYRKRNQGDQDALVGMCDVWDMVELIQTKEIDCPSLSE